MDRPAGRPPSREALSALPSPAARAVAFAAILLGGLAGGLIGWSFVSLQSSGDSDVPAAIGAYIGAVAAAAGTAVISVLGLRAMGEWRQLGDRT
jgi:hypothetical protein